jgi:hypothetical protein
LVSHMRSHTDRWEKASLSASVVVRGRMLESSDSQGLQGSRVLPRDD